LRRPVELDAVDLAQRQVDDRQVERLVPGGFDRLLGVVDCGADLVARLLG
jgi:hypothetical protein